MVSKLKSRYLVGVLRETVQNHVVGAFLGFLVLLFIPHFIRHYLLFTCGVIFLATIFAPLVTNCRPRGRVSAKGKAVFLSGCDSGFGYGTALALDNLGFQVFAGCLFPDGKGANNLRKLSLGSLHVVGLDVTNQDSIMKAADYVNEHLHENKLWAVVNNAGIHDGGELHWTNMDIITRVIDVNTFGVVRVTKTFLSQLLENKGRIITVASAAGRYTYPGMVPYCMSKQAAVSFSDGLRLEMYERGVKVITIEPWMYKTPITDEESTAQKIEKTWSAAPENIRQFYESGHKESFITKSMKILNYSVKDNPNEVVDCIEEAVTAEYPRYSYGPGTLYSRVSSWFVKRFPKPLADSLILDVFHGR